MTDDDELDAIRRRMRESGILHPMATEGLTLAGAERRTDVALPPN